MADLENALDQLLGDPEAMAQIMSLAERLKEPPGSGGAAPPPAEADTSDAPAPGPAAPDLGQLAPLLAQLQKGGGDARSDALLQALRPFLSEERRRKLDKAVRLSALARTARTALGMWKEGELSV